MSTIYQTKAEGLAVKQEILNQVVSGIKDVATQANAPTTYTAEAYPNGLFETYVVRTPLTMPNSWGSAVTQAELDANNVYFDVKNGVITKSLSFKNNEILEGSVTPQKTTFATEVFSFGKNRFDKTAVTAGKYVNAITGTLSDNAAYVSSDWVFVGDLQGLDITLSQLIHVAFYAEKTFGRFISGREYGGDTINVPNSAKWLRCSLFDNGMKETFQIEIGNSKTLYEAYQSGSAIFIENLLLPTSPVKPLPKILMPAVNYLMEGLEYNFYFKSFIVPQIAEKLENYYCSAMGYRGKFLEKKLRVTPTDDFNVYFKVENSEKSISENINFKTALTNSGNGVNRKVLVIGDSTINQEYMIDHIASFFGSDVMDVTFIGTRQTTAGNKHEGRSGWTMQNYIESTSLSGVANPFSNGGTFDFPNYLSANSQTMASNDWVFIQLGINDLYATALQDGSQTESVINDRINAMKVRLETMVNSIKSHNANIRVGIIQTLPPALTQDATGNLLASGLYSLEYYFKKGVVKWWEYLLEFYDTQAKKDSKIYLIPANAVLDRENNFKTVAQNIDSHNITQIQVGIDDVHPSVAGYKQIGDMYIGVIKYFG